MAERDETISEIRAIYGETQSYCCEAQMYLCATGLPSLAFIFCHRCNGELIGPLQTSRILELGASE